MKTHIETIVTFLAGQMDGQQPPPSGSAALERLSDAITAIQKSGYGDLQILALQIVGVVIDRIRSNLVAEQTLAALTRGDDHV